MLEAEQAFVRVDRVENSKQSGGLATKRSFPEKPFIEFSRNTLAIRRNLMIASAVTIISVVYGISLPSELHIGGGVVKGLDQAAIEQVLFVLQLYLLAHYLLNAVDEVLQWRLRLAAGKPFNGSFGAEGSANVPLRTIISDERTYYTGEHLLEALDQAEKDLKKPETWKAAVEVAEQVGIDAARAETLLANAIKEWHGHIQYDLRGVLRFEQFTAAYGRYQTLRLWCLEVGLPVAMACCAIGVYLWRQVG